MGQSRSPWSSIMDVELTGKPTLIPYVGSPIAPKFKPPELVRHLKFKSRDLALAVAKTGVIRQITPNVLLAIANSTLPMLDALIERGSGFELKREIYDLADTERRFFAARVGAGVTELYMNKLGYVWRANASSLSKGNGRYPDFIYHGGRSAGHGMVLAEAHGTFANSTRKSDVTRQSKNKYCMQVEKHLECTFKGQKMIHGYSIAFGSSPKKHGAYLSLTETQIAKPRRGMNLPSGQESGTIVQNDGEASDSYDQTPWQEPGSVEYFEAPTSIALASHRANFLLLGSHEVVEMIDRLENRDDQTPRQGYLLFLKVQYAEREFLLHPSSIHWLEYQHVRSMGYLEFRDYETLRSHWLHNLKVGPFPDWGCFAIEADAGTAFLNELSEIIWEGSRSTPDTLRLPSVPPAGFYTEVDQIDMAGKEDNYHYTIIRDGLAMLGKPKLCKILKLERFHFPRRNSQ